MRVCLIIEGAYPYIVGGVSSWTQNMIKALPDIEFSILSIMSGEVGEFKYELPDNVVDVHTVYLDGYVELQKSYFVKEPFINKHDTKVMKDLLEFDLETDLYKVQEIYDKRKSIRDTANLTRSKLFYKSIVENYQNKYSDLDFNKFIWSAKGMYSPFLQMFSTELPEADVYHSLSAGYAGLLAALAKVRYGKPFILSEHGIYTRERQEEIIKASWVDKVFKVVWIDFFNFISLLGYRYADVITSLFNDAKKLQAEYGAQSNKCVVISNGVDTTKFTVNREAHEGFNVGFITRVVPIKDVLTAIRSFYLVHQQDKSIKFLIMGPVDEDEEYFEQCLDLTASLGLSDVVEFMGLVNIREYLSILDVVMLSSVSEGQPLVLLEAMAAGIPCIASDVGSCAEVLGMHLEKKDRCGLIFEPTKYAELANLIMLLKQDEELRLRMGDNGAKRSREVYDYKDMIKKYRKLYEAV